MGNEFKNLFGDDSHGEDRPDLPVGEPENRVPRALNEKQVHIVGVYEQEDSLHGSTTFVRLEDNSGRVVPIFIGRAEAVAISMAVEDSETDRPMTYDLFYQILKRLHVEVERVVIDDIWQGVYYAKLSLAQQGSNWDIDCRPSDAVNLAIRFKAPIYVAESVLDAATQPS